MADILRQSLPDTVNGRLVDAAIRHAVLIERVKAGAVNKFMSQLRALNPQIMELIAGKLANINRRTQFSAASIREVNGLITNHVSPRYQQFANEVFRDLRDELDRLAGLDIQWQLKTLGRVLPSRVKVEVAGLPGRFIDQVPFVGDTLRGWTNSLAGNAASSVKGQLNIGLTQGNNIHQILERLNPGRAVLSTGGTSGRIARSLEGVIRTAITHVTTQAREQVFRENADIIRAVHWVSTLDTRTSAICISLDGREFPIDEGPRPPAHFLCRSIVVPITKSWKELGLSSSEVTEQQRASMDGQVPSRVTYSEWLKSQPTHIQSESLGIERAKMFARGELKVGDLVDANLKPLTLEQLRRIQGLN